MTREEIMTLGFEDLEKRAGEIATETAEADKEMIESLNAELDAIEERKMALNLEIEERKKAAEAVANGAGKEVEERTEKKMTDREIRSTQEYIDAYAEYVKAGCDLNKLEQRSAATLLSENVSGGTIAVPVYIEDRINTAWENNEIMRRVRRTYLPGNVKVGVEVSASAARIHPEGAPAITPEELVIEYVNLIPQTVKKLVEVSDTILDLKGSAFLNYLFDEIEYQIIKKCGNEVISAIINSSYAQTLTITATPTIADIYGAEQYMVGDANPVLIMTRATAAAIKIAALTANYAYDPFDGLEVLYTDNAEIGTNGFLLVDLNAVHCNFPNGAEPKFVFDEYTLAAENIVRIIGRLPMACDLVATGKAVYVSYDGGGE